MNLGLLILIICILGSLSNWLNWKYLNNFIVHYLYYIGAFVHETSHAIVTILTGAKVTEYKVFSNQPHIVHTKTKLPILGEVLISLAPIIGGLLFLFIINRYLLNNFYIIPQFKSWQDLYTIPMKIGSQINLFSWKSWLMILLFINVGAMISPSWQDLKNIWPLIIISLFFNFNSNSLLVKLCLVAITLIIINVIIQIIFILTATIVKMYFKHIK